MGEHLRRGEPAPSMARCQAGAHPGDPGRGYWFAGGAFAFQMS